MFKEATKTDIDVNNIKENFEIEFTLNSREKVGNEKRIKNWFIAKDNKTYMLKTNAQIDDEENYLDVAEIIAKKIFESVNIEYANYILTKYDSKRAVITEGFLKENEEFYSLEDILNGAVCHPENKEIIDYIYLMQVLKRNLRKMKFKESEIDSVILELNKVLVLDLVIANTDRHTENIGIIYNTKTGSIRLAPVFDSENSLMLEYDKNLVKELSNNYLGIRKVAREIYPKIAVVPKEQATGKEINEATLSAILLNCGDEIEDFLYDLFDTLDIEKILNLVDYLKDLPEIKTVVSACVEIRLDMLNRALLNDIDDKLDFEYLEKMKDKIKSNKKKNEKQDEVYDVFYHNILIGKYEVENGREKYTPDFEKIQKLNFKLFPILMTEIEEDNITFFSSRIINSMRFNGIIGYHTDDVELRVKSD